MSGLLIAGAGGHGRVVADAARLSQRWSTTAFVDDSLSQTAEIDGLLVLGKLSEAAQLPANFKDIVVAIGDNQARLTWLEFYAKTSLTIISVIHPTAVISPHSFIAPGSVIFANAVINTGTRLGKGCIINTGAIVDHDCDLADAVHISPGANLAGNVSVGRYSWIGNGASIRQQICIEERVIVGTGAAVVNDIMSHQIVVGVPAKALKSH